MSLFVQPVSFGYGVETAGSVAHVPETAGSVAFSGAETAGSVASSSSASSGGASSGGGFSCVA